MTNTEKFLRAFYKDHGNKDAVLITSNSSRFYLTSFSSSDGIVLVTENTAYLIVDFRYYEMAKKSIFSDVEIVLAEGRFSDTLETLMSKLGIETLWFESEHLSVYILETYKKRFPKTRFSSLGNFLNNLREVKNEEELNFIAEAQKITDLAFSHILDYISPEKTEKDIALELEFFMRKNGSEKVAFDTICVSGKKSSLPHGVPADVLLTKNSFLTMDFGAKFNGYCADMTRTVVLGRADEEMKKVYATVLEAQKRALDKIHSGVIGASVDRAARDYIYSSGYEGCFGHSTGHGLGIDVHESPSFSPSYNKPVPTGAVLSVEPGIYIEDKYGVRIEDIIVVCENGYRNFTHSPKDLIEI